MIIVSEKRARGPMWFESRGDRADGSGPSGSKAPDPLPNSPINEPWKLTKTPSAPSLQFASPSRPYMALSSLSVGGSKTGSMLWPTMGSTQGGTEAAWNPGKNQPAASPSNKEIALASSSSSPKFTPGSSPDSYRSSLHSRPEWMGYLNKAVSQRLPSNSPKSTFTGNVSKVKKFFSKFIGTLGKLKFHWQRATVDTGA